MERVVNREKTKNKKYIKEIKVSSMTIKFDGSRDVVKILHK
jgi:hypothetical protein